jgi:hypothetical protein
VNERSGSGLTLQGRILPNTAIISLPLSSTLEKAGLPHTPSASRPPAHPCATLLLGKGYHTTAGYRSSFGHSKYPLLRDYSHVLPGLGNQAAEAIEDTLNY